MVSRKQLKIIGEILRDKTLRSLLKQILENEDRKVRRPGFEPGTTGLEDPQIRLNKSIIEEFRKWLEERMRKGTAEDYYFRVRRMLRDLNFIISKDKIIDFLKSFKKNTMLGYKKAFKHFEEFLKEKGYNINIYKEIKSFGGWGKAYDIFSIVSVSVDKEDVIKGFQAIYKEDIKLFYALLTVTGLRRGEGFSIKVSDIDFESRVINLMLDRRTKKVFFVFFNSEVKDMLEDYIHRNKIESKVFTFSETKLKRELKRVEAFVGKKITPQVLRKFWATYSIENGMEPLLVDFLQGRVGYSVLAKHYLRPSIKSLKRQYDKVWEKFRFFE